MSFRRTHVARRRLVTFLLALAASGVVIAAIANAASTSPAFLISPTGLTFGYIPVGSTTSRQTVTIRNVSGVSQVMSGAGGAPGGEFGSSQNCEDETLAPGAACQMYYTFSPTATGAAHGTSSGTWNGQAFNIHLAGTGIPQLLITPTSLAFGDIKVGKTSPQQTVTIKNLSNSSVVMSGAGGAPGGEFGSSQNCEDETLTPGASCKMFYTFSPTTTGVSNGTSSGSWNGQSFSVALTGTGVS